MLFALIVFRITRFPFTLLTRILLFCNPIVKELKVRLPSGFRSIRLLMEKFFPGHLLLTSLRSRSTDPSAVEMSLILKNSFNSAGNAFALSERSMRGFVKSFRITAPVYSEDPSFPLKSVIETELVLYPFFVPLDKCPVKERSLKARFDFL